MNEEQKEEKKSKIPEEEKGIYTHTGGVRDEVLKDTIPPLPPIGEAPKPKKLEVDAWELKSQRLFQTKKLIEWLDTEEPPYNYPYREVKGYICSDKDPRMIEDLSFQNTLKRHLALLHEQGHPKWAFSVNNPQRQDATIEFEKVIKRKLEVAKPDFTKVPKTEIGGEQPIKLAGGGWALPGTPLYERLKEKLKEEEKTKEEKAKVETESKGD